MHYYRRKSGKSKKVIAILVAACLIGIIWFLSKDIPAPTQRVVKTIDNARFTD